MNRIMIIGCCGSGKSTLSRRLHKKLQLPLIHLDQHFHLPGWTEATKEEWREKVQSLANSDRWIIDGNYGGTMDIRFARADTVLYLKYSTLKCLTRVVKRTFQYYGKVRPDMPEGCPERFDLDFLHYVATYNMSRGPGILDQLDIFQGNKFILSNDRDVDLFVELL